MRCARASVWQSCAAITLALVVAGLSGNVSGQAARQKRFLTGPLTIEDQGSFFIGGVQKVTDHAVRAATGPGTTPPAQPMLPSPEQITIGQMYVQFQIPAKKNGGWPVIMVHGSSH